MFDHSRVLLLSSSPSARLYCCVPYHVVAGQYGMVLLSQFPIDAARTFQHFLYKDMPGALLPTDPATSSPWYDAEDLEVRVLETHTSQSCCRTVVKRDLISPCPPALVSCHHYHTYMRRAPLPPAQYKLIRSVTHPLLLLSACFFPPCLLPAGPSTVQQVPLGRANRHPGVTNNRRVQARAHAAAPSNAPRL